MPRNPRRLRVVILGLGHMGGRFLARLIELRRQLQREGIVIELTAVADKDPRKREYVVDHCARHNLRIRAYETFDDILRQSDIFAEPQKLLIYDASPSHLHFENLTSGMANRTHYFVEKPILLRNEDLSILPRYNFWCDFIETKNPAFLTAAQLVEEDHLQISRMQFWREGTTALKKLLRKERAGVTGGSLEDKLTHDLAVTVGLLGRNTVLASRTEHASTGQFEVFIPNRLDQQSLEDHIFMDLAGQPDGAREIRHAADGRFTAGVDWTVRDRTVHAEYRTSWVGASDHLRTSMLRLGIPEREWLGVESVEPKDLLPGYKVEEGRVAHLECADRSGGRVELLINFLSGDRKEFSGEITQYVKIRRRGRRFENVPLVECEYDDSLGGAFARVAKAATGFGQAPLLDAEVAFLVHALMIKARNDAVSKQYQLAQFGRRFVASLKPHFVPFTLDGLASDRPASVRAARPLKNGGRRARAFVQD